MHKKDVALSITVKVRNFLDFFLKNEEEAAGLDSERAQGDLP